MKHFSFFLLLLPSVFLSAQTDSLCPIRMGGGIFINCQHMIEWNGHDLLSIHPAKDNIISGISFTMFKQDGTVYAKIDSGLPSGDWSRFKIESSPAKYRISDAQTGALILMVFQDPSAKNCSLLVLANIPLPGNQMLQITPDDSNNYMLQMFRGSESINCGTALVIED